MMITEVTPNAAVVDSTDKISHTGAIKVTICLSLNAGIFAFTAFSPSLKAIWVIQTTFAQGIASATPSVASFCLPAVTPATFTPRAPAFAPPRPPLGAVPALPAAAAPRAPGTPPAIFTVLSIASFRLHPVTPAPLAPWFPAFTLSVPLLGAAPAILTAAAPRAPWTPLAISA